VCCCRSSAGHATYRNPSSGTESYHDGGSRHSRQGALHEDHAAPCLGGVAHKERTPDERPALFLPPQIPIRERNEATAIDASPIPFQPLAGSSRVPWLPTGTTFMPQIRRFWFGPNLLGGAVVIASLHLACAGEFSGCDASRSCPATGNEAGAGGARGGAETSGSEAGTGDEPASDVGGRGGTRNAGGTAGSKSDDVPNEAGAGSGAGLGGADDGDSMEPGGAAGEPSAEAGGTGSAGLAGGSSSGAGGSGAGGASAGSAGSSSAGTTATGGSGGSLSTAPCIWDACRWDEGVFAE